MRDQLRSIGAASTVGLDIAVSVVLGLLVGSWLDRKYGWAPWGVIAGLVLGTATGFNMLFKTAKKMQRQATHEQQQQQDEQTERQGENTTVQSGEHSGIANMTHANVGAEAHTDAWADVADGRNTLRSKRIYFPSEPNDKDVVDPAVDRASGNSSDDTHDAPI